MTRWFLWLLGGILLGGVVHLSTVLALPRTLATHDAYTRLLGADHSGQQGRAAADDGADKAIMPFMDPAFATAVCRYDLSRVRRSN